MKIKRIPKIQDVKWVGVVSCDSFERFWKEVRRAIECQCPANDNRPCEVCSEFLKAADAYATNILMQLKGATDANTAPN